MFLIVFYIWNCLSKDKSRWERTLLKDNFVNCCPAGALVASRNCDCICKKSSCFSDNFPASDVAASLSLSFLKQISIETDWFDFFQPKAAIEIISSMVSESHKKQKFLSNHIYDTQGISIIINDFITFLYLWKNFWW